MITRAEVLTAGHNPTPERLLLQGGSLRKVNVPTHFAVLHHKTEGVILFDTGYAPRLSEVTRGGTAALYRFATAFDISNSESAVAQLAAQGIHADDVRHIVISHFHPDHVGGLVDFPQATFHATRAAWDGAARAASSQSLHRAFFPELIPPGFEERVKWVERLAGPGIGPIDRTADLLGDGSLQGVLLPGHVAGQMGLLVDLDDGKKVLFSADACWFSAGYREDRPPSRIMEFFADDAAGARDSLSRLHRLSREHPEVRILPSHCPEVVAGVIS